MTKTELVSAVAEKTNVTKTCADTVVKAVFDTIKEQLANGESVDIIGFGKFHVAERAARVGRNPSTKEQIKIPASRCPKFRAGKALKDSVK